MQQTDETITASYAEGGHIRLSVDAGGFTQEIRINGYVCYSLFMILLLIP